MLIVAHLPIAIPCAAQEQQPPRTDRFGDPLPQGAVARLGTLRFCQPLPGCIVYSPDGTFLASGGYDNCVRLWDPKSGREIRVLKGHRSFVNYIALSADGKWLASGSQDADPRLWDVATGKLQQRFVGHTAPIERLALSPDGKVLASSCQIATLRMWDTQTGKEIRSIPIEKAYRVLAMAFSPDGKYFAFNNRSQQGIQLIDVSNGNRVRAFVGHRDNVEQLAFSANGATLYSGGGDHTLRAWDVASGQERRRFGDEKMAVRCLAVAPDGKTLTYGTYPDGMVHIWDIAAGKDLVPPWKAHPWCVVSIAYSPDSKKVAISRDSIAIHEVATAKRLNPPLVSDHRVGHLQHAPDGKRLAVWRDPGDIEIWEAARAPWRPMITLEPKLAHFIAMAFSPATGRLTTAEGDNTHPSVLCHWDCATGKRIKEFPGPSWIETLSYSADGAALAWRDPARQSGIVIASPATGIERARIVPVKKQEIGRRPRLSPDGRLLACSATPNAVTLWDTRTRKMLRGFGKPVPGSLQLSEFAPDGRTIATCGGNVDPRRGDEPDLLLWETATGAQRLHIRVNEGPLREMAYSPDGRLLVSSGDSGVLRVWDAWTGKAVAQLAGHRGWVVSLSFAPDGKTLASGGADGTVLIWDVSRLVPPSPLVERKMERDQLAKCWEDLGGIDAARAYATMAKLTWYSAAAVLFLRDKLTADLRNDADQLARLIRDLDNDDFARRDKAHKALAEMGRRAEAALAKALQHPASLECKRRLEDLLGRLEQQPEYPQRRVGLRAIEVLERIGSADARTVLDRLAKDSSDAEMAREAKASLGRLAKRARGPH
jgi:WD40 repeat protein